MIRNHKCGEFKIAKRMIKTNQVIISEQCLRNGDVVVAVSDEDNKIAWRSYHKNLQKKEFEWDRNSLSEADAVSNASR